MQFKTLLSVAGALILAAGISMQVAQADDHMTGSSDKTEACCAHAEEHAVTTTAAGTTTAEHPAPRIGIWAADGSYYPISTCLVSGEPVGHNPAKTQQFDLAGRPAMTCCGHCRETVEASPEKYHHVMDELVIKEQSADYPLTTCPVSGEELGGMGEPVKIVVNNYLVKLCCAGCGEAVKADPSKVLAKLEAFWSAPKPAETPTTTPAAAPASE